MCKKYTYKGGYMEKNNRRSAAALIAAAMLLGSAGCAEPQPMPDIPAETSSAGKGDAENGGIY